MPGVASRAPSENVCEPACVAGFEGLAGDVLRVVRFVTGVCRSAFHRTPFPKGQRRAPASTARPTANDRTRTCDLRRFLLHEPASLVDGLLPARLPLRYVGVCRSLPAVKPDPGPVNYPVGWLSFHIHVLDGLTSVRPDGPFGNRLGYSRSVPRWLDQQLPSASHKVLLWQTAEADRIQRASVGLASFTPDNHHCYSDW